MYLTITEKKRSLVLTSWPNLHNCLRKIGLFQFWYSKRLREVKPSVQVWTARTAGMSTLRSTAYIQRSGGTSQGRASVQNSNIKTQMHEASDADEAVHLRAPNVPFSCCSKRSVCVYIPEVATPGTPLLTSLQRKRILPLAPEPCKWVAGAAGRRWRKTKQGWLLVSSISQAQKAGALET